MAKGTVLGKVYLVGAGPGDPGLLTLRGKEVLEKADVVIYDRLASPRLLAFAPKDAEFIYVGKRVGRHTVDQDGINRLIVEKAKEGLNVVRLKGGDPFIFGRGGEEAEVLSDEGIPFEVVPGVTSAISVPAYAGIPLTHRRYTSSVAFVTGHLEETKQDAINWQGLATAVGTIVFLMGMKNLPFIVEQLTKYGRSPDTPVAIIRWGTTPRHKSVKGRLSDIVEKVNESGLRPPAIIVIGDVAALSDKLSWYENLPLLGKRVLVTRTREQASKLVEGLERKGALCIECPTIQIRPPDDLEPLDNAIEKLMRGRYQWIIFSSTNAVKFFFDRLWQKGLDLRALGEVKIAAVGSSTASELEKLHLRVDLIPKDYQGEGLLEAFSKVDLKDKGILIPRAQKARAVLPDGLTRMGARVRVVTAYVNTIPDIDEEVIEKITEKPIDIATFTSSSTVKNFFKLLGADRAKDILSQAKIACIGPITAKTIEDLGLKVDIMPDEATIPSLIKEIESYFEPSAKIEKNIVE